MDKQNYYVKVESGEILPDKTLSEWEFEIKATDEEVSRLQTIMEQTDIDAWGDFWRAHTPLAATPEGSGDAYDNDMKRIYEMLYELGTEETKEHIKTMRIIEET